MERLDERRMKLIISFAKKTAKNPKFAHWFLQNKESDRKHRVPQTQYKTVHTRTERFKRSAIPFMTDLLNCESMTEKEETISCDNVIYFFPRTQIFTFIKDLSISRMEYIQCGLTK